MFVDFETTFHSLKREFLYDTLLKLYVPSKLVRIIKTCLDDTRSKERIGNYSSSSLPIEKGLKQGAALFPQLEYDPFRVHERI